MGTPERLGEAASLADRLRRHPVILPTVDSSVRTGFDALADRLGVRPQIVAEVEDMAMMRLLARVPPELQDPFALAAAVDAVRFVKGEMTRLAALDEM